MAETGWEGQCVHAAKLTTILNLPQRIWGRSLQNLAHNLKRHDPAACSDATFEFVPLKNQ
jgi:hypothetical protein